MGRLGIHKNIPVSKLRKLFLGRINSMFHYSNLRVLMQKNIFFAPFKKKKIIFLFVKKIILLCIVS